MACYHARDASAKFLILRGIDVLALSKLEKTAFDVFGSAPHGLSEGKEKVDRLNALKAIHYDILLRAHVAMKRPAQVVEKQLLAQDHADVAFVSSEGERIYAHKFVVTAYSPQFKAMLSGAWAENKNAKDGKPSEVQMVHSAGAIRALLKFMYTGRCDDKAIGTNLHELLELADQHDLSDLKNECEVYFNRRLSTSSVIPYDVGNRGTRPSTFEEPRDDPRGAPLSLPRSSSSQGSRRRVWP